MIQLHEKSETGCFIEGLKLMEFALRRLYLQADDTQRLILDKYNDELKELVNKQLAISTEIIFKGME